MNELGSLAWPIILLALLGAAIILHGVTRARYVARTASPVYASVPMRVLNVRLAPLKIGGTEIATDPLTAKSSMVVVAYGYEVGGKAYVSDAVFPLQVEWWKPRVSPLRFMDDLESGRLRNCHVDVENPAKAVLFTGWSPPLRSHVLAISVSGLLLLALSAVLWWSI